MVSVSRGSASPKRLYKGRTQKMVRGQLYKDPRVEKKIRCKGPEAGNLLACGRTAGHCRWDPGNKEQVAGSIQRMGVQGLNSLECSRHHGRAGSKSLSIFFLEARKLLDTNQ